MSNVNDEFPYLEMNESSRLDEYLTELRTPKQYGFVRTIAYILKFIAVVASVFGVVAMSAIALLESSAFIVMIVSLITAIIGIYTVGCVLDMLVDIAISVHKAAMSLEQLANRNRRK